MEINLLQFLQKSFSYSRTCTVGGEEYAVFLRTETESESKFRPKTIRLAVIVPRGWILLDEITEELVIGRDGGPPGTRKTTQAIEVAAEKSEFEEQGVAWKRANLSGGGMIYVPEEFASTLLTPEGRDELGLK